jgi:hypothetical protein
MLTTRKFIKFGIDSDGVNSRLIPANYTPSNYSPLEVSSEGADKTSSHLKGIDTVLGLVAPVSGDIALTSFSTTNNQSSFANVTGLSFSNSVTRSAFVMYSITIDATTDLFEEGTLELLQKSSSWSIVRQSIGDDTGIEFSITSSGQVQYKSSNISGFVSGVIKFKAETLGMSSVTSGGSSPTLSVSDFYALFSADNFTSVSSGSQVSGTWASLVSTQSGWTSKALTLNSTNPSYNNYTIDAGVLNNKPYINYPSAFLNNGFGSGVAQYTIFVLYNTQYVSPQVNCRAIQGYTNNWLIGAYGNYTGGANAQKSQMYSDGTSFINNFSDPGAAQTGWVVGTMRAGASIVQAYYNGIFSNSKGRAVPNLAGPNGLVVGAGYGIAPTEGSYAKVAEVIVYDRALTDADVNAVHSYLASKYGLTIASI